MNKKIFLRYSGSIFQHFLDILFPIRCAGCQRSGHILCPACASRISPLSPPFCQGCGVPLPLHGIYAICRNCQYHPLRLNGLRAVSLYQEPLRSYIHALKYDGNTRLAEPLGHLLAQAYISYNLQADIIIPVPLHSERQKQRGYNHAYLLAMVCAAQVGVPLRNDILIRHRATLAQVGLKAVERQQNVAGAFLCTPPFATGALLGHRILLIDDVSTSAATLEACAAPLFGAGASAVWGLVLARPIS
jgi:ComF family protein